jgi:xanthine dehydrogenase accessory factor
MNMFDEFLSRAAELRSHEQPFATAVVVRCVPPVSGKPGDKAIIEVDGSVWGWIGGGCVQPLVVREALKAIADGQTPVSTSGAFQNRGARRRNGELHHDVS